MSYQEIGLLFIGAILGWIGQWLFYKYQRRSERQQGPKVVISRVVQEDQILIEVRNIGTDSLSNMEINISWIEGDRRQEKKLNHFFDPGQNVYSTSARLVEVLGPSERYYVADVPSSAQSGIVNVEVSGLGVQSQRSYETSDEIEVGLPPSQ